MFKLRQNCVDYLAQKLRHPGVMTFPLLFKNWGNRKVHINGRLWREFTGHLWPAQRRASSVKIVSMWYVMTSSWIMKIIKLSILLLMLW